ncbi:hypothetical protein C0Q70_11320 [Pomacea canaliculata]|uniref:C1q domain-containing protein n=1 Tax=Pomacea canaliculata TaxID=400727 RepID=A0A2T7P5Q0_POMCA|nr:hypothetical protein C0Q70_11320 [Pomacea canaliculata]
MTKLTRDIADMKDKLPALETTTSSLEKQQTAVLQLEALKEENSNLQSQVVSLREADSRMQENMDTLQQNVEKIIGQFSVLQKDITYIEHELQAIKVINIKLQNDVDSSQQESLLIKTETKKLQDAAEELSESFKTFKASSLVAFNARLHESSPAGDVILSKVDCNVGQAYDDKTGIFTVPVTGIYFFMARAMAAEEPRRFYVHIMVDGLSVAVSGSFRGKPYHGMNCTVHLVQRLIKGQKRLTLRNDVVTEAQDSIIVVDIRFFD